jgi:hypothetical protein
MSRHVALLLGGLALGIVIYSTPAFAQYYGPSSAVGGNASTELNRIYGQASGGNYSVSSLNRFALDSVRAQVPNVGQQSTNLRNPSARVATMSSPTRLNKPFSGYSPSPTVSPYLNLFRTDLGGNNDLNYNTLVRPQLQQQQLNAQVQRQNIELSRRVQSIAAQADYNVEGSKDELPTGHQTAFMYTGHYFPQQQAHRPRKQLGAAPQQ